MLKPGTRGSAVARWPAELFWTSSRPAAIAALSFVFPAAAFANCVLQADGVTAICDTSAPNPFPSSVNANPTTGGYRHDLDGRAPSCRFNPARGSASPGAAVQVRNNSIVNNNGSVSTSLINGYRIWAGDPSNSTSTTAGFGDTLQNNGSIVTTGPNAIGLFARIF